MSESCDLEIRVLCNRIHVLSLPSIQLRKILCVRIISIFMLSFHLINCHGLVTKNIVLEKIPIQQCSTVVHTPCKKK